MKDERWARLRRSLWQPPRPHGEQPRERTVGPLELFYDLAAVVLVALVAVVVGFGAWWTYFDFAGQRLPRTDRGASLQWIVGHLPLTGAIAAVLCLGAGAIRPAPLILGVVLVVLLAIPWGLAVAHRLAENDSPPSAESPGPGDGQPPAGSRA